MDLNKSGILLAKLRKSKGMTQKEVADILGVEAKTVSKWERGRGFPDVSFVSALSDIFGVNERILLSGNLVENKEETGNMKRNRYFVCPHCGSIVHGVGNYNISCCGKKLSPLLPKPCDKEHRIEISECENDFYVKFNHNMTKEHYISFISYASYDRVLLIRLYPEQDCTARFPKMYGGKLYFYCTKDGLYEYEAKKKHKANNRKNTNLTALLSAFARAYICENSENPVFSDSIARKLFSDDEYEKIINFIISAGKNVKSYVNTQLAPTPLGRAVFCEETLNTAIKTGTRQYVILGSGLDTFALRNNDENIQIYEIDKSEVISDKLSRIERAGLKVPNNVHYISADLSDVNLFDVLKENGLNQKLKTLFSCLGLFYYLTKDEISGILAKISEFSANGSGIVFDFADNHLFTSELPEIREMVKSAEAGGAPMKSCFGCSELEFILQKYDFLIYEFLNDKEIETKFFGGCQEDLHAFAHINYAHAVLHKNL